MQQGKFIVIVLDGFGIGQMPDVPEVRPADIGSHTCGHIFEAMPELSLPNLAALGLANAAGIEYPGLPHSNTATWGRSMLMHNGADTFYGHQEIMGTKPPDPKPQPIQGVVDEVAEQLSKAGYTVRFYTSPDSGLRFLIVNEVCTVADNIESDPGQALNVTAALDDIDFEDELKIGRIVRSVAKNPRVITFGGRGIHLPDLLAAVEEHDGYIGVSAPASGVYDNDYHCIHMGYGVNEQAQVPYILGERGINVHLLGKVADVCANHFGTSESIVDTRQVLERTLELVQQPGSGFICANVQETDLMGHGENVAGYAEKLMVADEIIGLIVDALAPEDVLIIQADHGNDPTIGHPHHTREYVPLLIKHGGAQPGEIGTCTTLSDVGASVSDYFDCPMPENGTSFWPQINKGSK